MPRRKLTEEEKRAKEAAEYAELLQKNLQSNLNRLLEDERYGTISEPSVLYKIGDRVQHGMLDASIVTEVHANGKILKLREYYKQKRQYTNIFDDVERDFYVAWHEVEPYRTPEEMEAAERFFTTDPDLERVHMYNTDLRCLISSAYHPGIDRNVSYQRDFVWSEDQQVALIDSIFHQIPIGCFIVNRRAWAVDTMLYEIIDGKQRLSTILKFFEGKLKYKGKTYYQLHRRDQCEFERTSVLKAETQELTEAQKLNIFLKFNTTGKPQEPSHLEKVRRMLEEELKKTGKSQ